MLARYADAKRAEKKIKADLDELKPVILDYMQDDGTEELESEYGTFTIQNRRTWTFSLAVESEEKVLKNLKKIEQQEGTATSEEKASLYFKAAE